MKVAFYKILIFIFFFMPFYVEAKEIALNKAKQDVETFIALFETGVKNDAMFDTLYHAYQTFAYLSADSKCRDLALEDLRIIRPYMENGAIYYSDGGDNKKALDFALAYINIPRMDVFLNERFSNSNTYPRLCYAAATWAYKEHRFNDVVLCVQSYIETGDSDYLRNAYSFLAQSYGKMGKYQDERTIVDEALLKYPNDLKLIYEGINASIAMQDHFSIDKYVDKALAVNPTDSKALPLKARRMAMSGNWMEAYPIYKKLYHVNMSSLDFSKEYATVVYNYALELIEVNAKSALTQNQQQLQKTRSAFIEAASVLERVTVASPAETKYMLALLDTYKRLGKESEANKLAEKIQMLSSFSNQQDSTSVDTLLEEKTQMASVDKPKSIEKRKATIKTIKDVPPFSSYAKGHVESVINEWQLKDDYETMAEYKERVNDSTRTEKIKHVLKEAEQYFIAQYSPLLKFDNLRLGDYDAEHEVYLITSPYLNQILLPVPRKHNEARKFKENWHAVTTKNPKYGIFEDKLMLTGLTFQTQDGKNYAYSKDSALLYQHTHIEYHFDEVDILGFNKPKRDNQLTIINDSVSMGHSDIDVDIPIAKKSNENLFVLIIANEKYRHEDDVKFAYNDGESMREYCVRLLGCPEDNVMLVKDATLNEMKREIDLLGKLARVRSGNARILFYYAGHGVPDDATKQAYLLPADGYSSNISTGFRLDELYSLLGSMPAEQITVLLDACFSGTQRNDKTLAAGARAVALKAETSVPIGNMVVITAASGSETALSYDGQQHGLFTYYLLKRLKETEGKVRYGDLIKYVIEKVSYKSIVENKKSQTPSFMSSPDIGVEWRKWRFLE